MAKIFQFFFSLADSISIVLLATLAIEKMAKYPNFLPAPRHTQIVFSLRTLAIDKIAKISQFYLSFACAIAKMVNSSVFALAIDKIAKSQNFSSRPLAIDKMITHLNLFSLATLAIDQGVK